MKMIKIKKIGKVKGECIAPPDKSISQRAVMISALSNAEVRVDNFLDCDDCRRAISAFRSMGIKIILKRNGAQGATLFVRGKGLKGLKKAKKDIYIGNSGTTMRLITGILAAQDFRSVLSADPSLSVRPMKRITEPLRAMGALIKARKKAKEEYPPLIINGRNLKSISYRMPVTSAQVKSCILLAGLFSRGTTRVKEQIKTRDHTERMLMLFKASISVCGLTVSIKQSKELVSPKKMFVPGDISSAAFFIIAATLLSGSRLKVKKVGLNPTRIYLLKILKRMGANIEILKNGANLKAFEPYADIQVFGAPLKSTTIKEDEVAYCIDELPILCVAACFAKGKTKIIGAGELRVKETDRIYSMVNNLRKMGADIENLGNDLMINGTGRLCGAEVESFGDHRTAMSMVIAGLMASGQTTVKNTSCINKSFPEFMETLKNIAELT
ncbi:MAG: 3-phosphoshikimate 1-carboxyvinyltransferase [Candidatus Omnitrophica bacterium]|nr:3-phosphoshikimate 1-carboxyvinyltransferase [Candidatus Omnitrophota bacterium]